MTESPSTLPAEPPTRLMLIEDHVDHRLLAEVLVSTFRQPAVVVAQAGSIAEAELVLADHADEIDAIICDLGLPDGNGETVIEAVRKAAPDKPVVVLTSQTEFGMATMRLGVQDYLVKGQIDSIVLERSIRYAIARQSLANELAATTRDIEHLVYSVTHDIRGPLSVANGFIGLMEEANLSGEMAGYVAPIRRSINRVEAIAGDLMEYAKSVHGPLTLAPTDLNLLVRVVMQDLLLTEHVEVVRELPTVLADGRLLRHVIENLLGNAVKYAHPDRPARVVVDVGTHPVGWRVTIDDNGRGIPPDSRDRVFDMFVRVAEGEVDGTGIGLAICRRAIERHQGRIWVEDNPSGEGSRFVFVLPKSLATPEERAGPSVRRPTS